jgi:hypothetical protein
MDSTQIALTAPIKQKSHRIVAILFLAILALAFALRVYRLDAEGLWLDEFFSMEISSGRGFADQSLPRATVINPPPPALTSLAHAPLWTAIWSSMRADSHPPLYFLLLRGWRTLFGSDDWTVRFLSVLTSIGAIIVLFVIATNLYGSTVALWACLLMAISVPQLVYAQEARNNPLLVFTGLSSSAALIFIEKRGPTFGRLILLSLALLAMMLTHYYCIGAILAMAFYVSITFRGRKRLQTLIAFFVAAAIYLLIWGPILIQQRDAIAKWHQTGQTNPIAMTLQQLGVAPLRQFTRIYSESNLPAAATALICVVALILLRRRRDLWLWWMWTAGIFGTLFFHDLRGNEDHLLLPKYALLAGPALFLLVCGGAQRLPFAARHLIPLLAAALCLCNFSAVYAPYRGDWRDPGIFILQRAARADVVVFCGAAREDWASGWNYLCLTHYVDENSWPCPIILLNQPLSEGPAMEHLRRAQRIFVVIDSPEIQPQFWLPGAQVNPQYVYFPFTASVWEAKLPRAQPTTRSASAF